ncbi:MAG: sigma-70 family RNA polymerase sigma factor [Bacteroidota bacterium]
MNQHEISEGAIIDRAVKGDEVALRQLLEKHKSFAFTIALRIVKNREDAEEIVQDGFIKAFKALRSFKRTGKFSTWLYKIIYNTALTSIRGDKKIFISMKGHSDEQLLPIPEHNDSGLEKLKTEDQKKYLSMAINRLDETERLLITLYYTCELSIAEVSEITGANPSTIKVKLHRARLRLRDVLSSLLKSEMDNLL